MLILETTKVRVSEKRTVVPEWVEIVLMVSV